MGRNENQEKRKQADQVGVVYVARFIEKKEIAAAKEQKNGADAVEKSGGNECGQNGEHNSVNIESVSGPGMNPGKAVVFK